MAVRCQLRYKGELSKKHTHICFGFLSTLNKVVLDTTYATETVTRIGINADSWNPRRVEEVLYFPHDLTKRFTEDSALFIQALEKLGINKVIQYLDPKAKTARDRYNSGLVFKTHTCSTPMAIGAMEMYRIVQNNPKYCEVTADLLRAGVAPKLAVFVPTLFINPGRSIGNAAMNPHSIEDPGYGSFDIWTSAHIKNDKLPLGKESLKYGGIHRCYTLPVRKKFKTGFESIVGTSQYISYDNIRKRNAGRDLTSNMISKAYHEAQKVTTADILAVCRKIQNGSL